MFNFFRPAGAGVQRISPADAVARANKGELTIVDVREVAEVRATGKAKGAIHIPMVLVSTKADPKHPEHDKRLSPEKPVALYCASGARSGAAAGLLARLGYAEVYNLGGLNDWRAGGGAIER